MASDWVEVTGVHGHLVGEGQIGEEALPLFSFKGCISFVLHCRASSETQLLKVSPEK